MVRWPAGIAQPGRQVSSLVGQVDVLATIAGVVQAKLPDDGGEDSVSFSQTFQDVKSDLQRAPLITHGNDGRYAVTHGDWKLILGKTSTAHELYRLRSDRAETKNVAESNPEKVSTLTTAINQIITHGRTTAGPVQPNDTGYWKDLVWLEKSNYESMSAPVGPAR